MMEQLENAQNSSLTEENGLVTTEEDQDFEYYNGKKMPRLPDFRNDEGEDQEKTQDEDSNDVQDDTLNTSTDSVEHSKKKLTTLQNKVEQTTYLITSYPLMLKYDRDTSAFLSLLIDNEDYNEKRKKDGYFMATREYISTKLNITARIQERIIDVLVKDGLIEYKRMGVPVRGWIRLNENAIIKVLEEFKSEQKTKNKPL